jgi:hypothetical protein
MAKQYASGAALPRRMQTVIEGNSTVLASHASAEGGSPERERTRSEG